MAEIAGTVRADGPPASMARLYPVERLALSIVVQALKDYYSADWLTSIDALHFLISDHGAAFYLDACGQPFDSDPDHIFRRLVTNDEQANNYSRNLRGRNKRHVSSRVISFPGRAGGEDPGND